MAEGGREIFHRRLILPLLLVVLCASLARAVTLAEITQKVNQATAGGLGEEQEQALFGEMADVSVEVANRYDQWVRTGSAEHKYAAAGLADGLLVLLERLQQYHQGKIDRAQDKIIAEDGNPEVLYDQKWWQLDRGFALAASGQLAWLHYRSAMLHPENKEKRPVWLKKSVKEFSEFVGSQDPKMRSESFLGRAMAQRELGDRDEAAADLKVILDEGKANPLYWPARLALAEVRSSAGGAEALSETQRLLAEASAAGLPRETLNQIRLLRLEALAATADSERGMSDSVRREAMSISSELSQIGPAWSKRVTDIALAHMKDPRQLLGATASAEWIAAENLAAAEKFKEAAAAYEGILRSTDPSAREHATDVHHRLGVCYFRLNRFADSEREFRTYLNQAPQSALAPEAAYLQFRAAEGLYRARTTPETRGMFTAAVENFVKNYPRYETWYEGAFRWAEVLQGDRRFAEAASFYAQVKGAPAFEIRAAAAEIECLGNALSNPPEKADKEWAEGLRARGAKAYERFVKLAGSQKNLATPELRARMTLSKAMVESSGPSPRLTDALGTLRDFEKTYPDSPDLHLLAAALRLAAASGLRHYEEAERGVAALPPPPTNAGFADILEKVARGFLRTSADAAPTDPALAEKWAGLAGKMFDRLKAEGRPIAEDVKSNLALIYTEQGRLDDAAALYRDLVAASPQSKTVLRAAAMLADRRNNAADGADYWGRLAMLQEVASPSWYEARIATAKGLLGSGQADKACRSVREVEDFRPDLRDAPTKERFAEIAAQACPKQ